MMVRPAMPEDGKRIVDVWFESARHHAEISPERCHLPQRETIVERYRGGEQFPTGVSEGITLVAETEVGVVGYQLLSAAATDRVLGRTAKSAI